MKLQSLNYNKVLKLLKKVKLLLPRFFKNQKQVAIELANWLVKQGDPIGAKKIMNEVIKENSTDKSARADYAIIMKEIKEQTISEKKEENKDISEFCP